MSSYNDLRDWLRQVETMGELKVVKGADWNLEVGAVTDLVAKKPRDNWTLLFDEIKGYPAGYRILTCILESPSRLGLTVGLDSGLGDRQFVTAWRERLKTLKPIPPEFVQDGPVLENVHRGGDINLWEFPSPHWHEFDGGRYIGTASATVTRDPDEGWINLGTYRVMVHDRATGGFYISPGKDGRIHRDKYFARQEACPVVVAVGEDPLLFLAATMPITHTRGGFESEYDWAGGVRGRPVQVIRGSVTGLPIPAHAEIVLEGWAYPGKQKMEGPFGEWTGYYPGEARPEPTITVEAVYHRNDPIICGVENSRMPSDFSHAHELMRAAQLWAEMEAAGVPEIRGVAFYQTRFITVVSIEQQYAGHAKQAAMLAMQCHSGAYLGRYVIVVDEDINVYDFSEVVWAVSTRVDPIKDIEIVSHCWSGSLDPIIPPEEKGFNSRAMIDATKPFRWKSRFPKSTIIRPELKARVIKKWEGEGLF